MVAMEEVTNELIALKVMGWTECITGTAYWKNSDGGDEGPFFPLEHAGDDFRVFKKVREWWKSDDFQTSVFYHQLHLTLIARSAETDTDRPLVPISYMNYYQPGDYSRAAFIAVTSRARPERSA